MIESLFAVSLDMVEVESVLINVAVVSLTVVFVSVDSVFVLEQADAKAIIDSRRNADFFMSLLNLSQVDVCF